MTALDHVPLKVFAQHIGVLGKTGAGKTYLAKSMIVEPLLERGGRVVVIDPTGVYYGLRLSPTGKKASPFSIVIFGGRHGDLPLNERHGEAIAEAVATTTTPVIIDTSLMRVGERTRFLTDFAETLIIKNRGQLHLIIDEAHLFAPQGKVNDPQSGKLVHAANNLVSLGRSRGLCITLITQRPAKLHKDSLSQVETLVAMRLIAPQDRRAVEDWIGEWADPKQGKEIIASLPSLSNGEGILWSPEIDVLSPIKVPRIQTFDSGKSDVGTDELKLKPIDITGLQGKLEEVAATARENDPARLKAELVKLQREKAAAPAKAAPPDKFALNKAHKAGYVAGFNEAWDKAHSEGWHNCAALVTKALDVRAAQGRSRTVKVAALKASEPVANLATALDDALGHIATAPAQKPVRAQPRANNGQAVSDLSVGLGKAERSILGALAQHGRSMKNRLAILAGYSVRGGGFNNALGSLRSRGFVTRNEPIEITDAGRDTLVDWEPLPVGDELVEYWMGQLGKAEREILRVITSTPDALTKEEVADRAGYEARGGGFNNALGKLRTLGLVVGKGEIIAAEELR